MFTRVIAGTPVWVWPLLLALLALGMSQTWPRDARLLRILILPLVMTVLSLAGTVTSFGFSPMVLLAWCVSAGIVVWGMIRRPVPAFTRYDRNTGLFHLPGSWMPLVLILGIFTVKYIVGATLSVRPAMSGSLGFATLTAALYGAFSGGFIARAGRLWRLSKRP